MKKLWALIIATITVVALGLSSAPAQADGWGYTTSTGYQQYYLNGRLITTLDDATFRVTTVWNNAYDIQLQAEMWTSGSGLRDRYTDGCVARLEVDFMVGWWAFKGSLSLESGGSSGYQYRSTTMYFQSGDELPTGYVYIGRRCRSGFNDYRFVMQLDPPMM